MIRFSLAFNCTRRLRSQILLGLLFFFLLPSASIASGLSTSAEYIVGFLHYVSWPNSDAQSDWQVCVVGNPAPDPSNAYGSKLVHDRRISTRPIDSDKSLTGCDVLDLTSAGEEGAKDLVQRARHLPILTVGSGRLFCTSGGMICLLTKGNDHTFEVNLSAVRGARLNVSARLLTLGENTETREGQP